MNDELLMRLVSELTGIREELAGIRQGQIRSGWITSLPHYIGVVLAAAFVLAFLVMFYLSTTVP